MLAAFDVELPAVPRTRDDAAVEAAFAEWAALVRTDAVEGKELARHVVDGDDAIAGDGFQARAGRAIGDGGDAVPHEQGPGIGGQG
jgi:hypothetical protein